MKLDLKSYAHRQLAFFEALRRLGFTADEIFVAFYNNGELFTLVRQDKIEFNISISLGEKIDAEAYREIWNSEGERWNGPMSEAERDELYRKEFSVERLVELAFALKAKGMDLRAKELN